MKISKALGIVAVLLFAAASASLAGTVTITFDEPGIIPYATPGFTTDPGYNLNPPNPPTFAGTRSGEIQFYGGDTTLSPFNATLVENWDSVSGNSLANGWVDTHSVIFVKATDKLITSISAQFDMQKYQDSRLTLTGYDSGGNLMDSAVVLSPLGEAPWIHTISLSNPSGFASVEFMGCYLTCSPFVIDNVTLDTIDFTEAPPSEVVPEPATIVYVLSGMGGLLIWLRRQGSRRKRPSQNFFDCAR